MCIPKPIEAPAAYMALYPSLWHALGYPQDRRPIVIGVDGRNGKGKTSVANWIGWQFETEAIHLDLFMMPGTGRVEWQLNCLHKLFEGRRGAQGRRLPVLIEGILLLDALKSLSLKPDFMIFAGPDSQADDPSDLQNKSMNTLNANILCPKLTSILNGRLPTIVSGCACHQKEDRPPFHSAAGQFKGRVSTSRLMSAAGHDVP